MMAVKWEFQGNDLAAAQTVVTRILKRYRQALGGIRCPVHGAASTVVIRGRTLDDLTLSIEPCCQILLDEADARLHRGRGRRSSSTRPLRMRSERRSGIRRAEPDYRALFLHRRGPARTWAACSSD